jgi:hypothetical protein
MAVAPKARDFVAPPAFQQTSAFGSPGGFPFMGVQDHRGAVPRFGARRVARPRVFTAFPAFPFATFLSAPLGPYVLPSEAPSPTVTVSPVTYVSPTVYVSVPVASAAPAPVAVAAAPPSAPSVVEYATGRYELRGDGASAPYTWVWIPNPPASPPASSPEAPAATTPSPVGPSQLYRWTDEQGTEFWTNRLEKIPEPYRSRVGSRAQLAAQQ